MSPSSSPSLSPLQTPLSDVSPEGEEPRITRTVLFLVGTHQRSFNRLVEWSDRLAVECPELQVFVQYGNSSSPHEADGAAFLTKEEMSDAMNSADAVVSHGGPATLIEAARSGLLPVVVPRDPFLGEHIDDHQIRFSKFIDGKKLAFRALSYDEMKEKVLEILTQHLHVDKNLIPSPTGAINRIEVIAQNLVNK